MIISFKSKALELFYVDDNSSKIQSKHIKKVSLQLSTIDEAESLDDIRIFTSWKFHKLKGQDNLYAIWVDENYRIWFKYDKENNFFELVDYGDYH
jgi:plasmid maintenance system killer protein